MPDLVRAELVEGIVYLHGAPIRLEVQGQAYADFVTWLGMYKFSTPGVANTDCHTVRLDSDNEFQPDAILRIFPECGGQSRLRDNIIEGAPEFVAEIAASSASYDLGEKLKVYRRNGVREYVVWRTWDRALDWFTLRDGKFELQTTDANGLHKSEVFPGLWLDPAALLSGDGLRLMEVLQRGIATPEHAQFVEQLKQRRA